MLTRNRCQCLHCKELFVPNARLWWHQQFCSKPECRQASKAQSQRRWLSKPENQDHFRGSSMSRACANAANAIPYASLTSSDANAWA
jgi:hypothetical protein